MINNKAVVAASLLVAAVVLPRIGLAVGIGEARVESFLGEPLRIRIALVMQPRQELDAACIEIASPPNRPSAYLGDLVDARIELRKTPGGGEIVISTRRPFTEPILVLPLKVGCPVSGVSYRELTFLVDPPGLPAPVQPVRTAPAARAAGAAAGSAAASGGQWYVEPGQTLSGIIVASGLDGGDRRRRREMIDAVVAANPDVFRGRGPDYLPAGATLTLPGWSGTRTAAAPARRPAARASTPPAAAPPAAEYQLRLTAPETPPAGSPSPPLEQVTRGVSELDQRAEQERTEYLELQQRLDRLQRDAAELEVTAQRLAGLLAEMREPLRPGSADAGASAAAPPANAAGTQAEAAPAAQTAAVQPRPASPPRQVAAPPLAPPPPADETFWRAYALPAGVVLVIVLLIAILLARRGRDQAEPVRESPRQAPPSKAPERPHMRTVSAPPPPTTTRAETQRVEPYIAETGSSGRIDVEEVDNLLEQVEVLLLFGEPADAIELLQRHIGSAAAEFAEPRPWLKLLQILRGEQRMEEFNEVAGSFTRMFNIERPRWETFAPGLLDVAGVTLEEACPHLIGHIERAWGDPSEALRYIDSLIIDDRGGTRSGFAHSVASDLLLLRDIARSRV